MGWTQVGVIGQVEIKLITYLTLARVKFYDTRRTFVDHLKVVQFIRLISHSTTWSEDRDCMHSLAKQSGIRYCNCSWDIIIFYELRKSPDLEKSFLFLGYM